MAVNSVSSSLKDFAGLKSQEYRNVVITLKAAQSAVGTESDRYKVPAHYKLILHEIRGHLAMITFASETLAIGNLTSVQTIVDRIALKAMNCRVKLWNIDTSLPITEEGSNSDMSLASLMEVAGGRPIEFPLGQQVPSGETLQMDSTLIQSTAAVLGGSTEYGVVLIGTLVRVSGD